ncbi:MAG TPA: hypothetical protein VFI53_20835 [Myxococcaceae bacterium]|nr:hypothetical protein [Myxococcaceae bacterium]
MEHAESTRRWERFEPWAAGLALVWCGVRLGRGLGPAAFYNSDCAVPILVMQGMGEGAFTLFYPRQDRFGTWPFLLGRALHLQTPEAFHVMSVLGLCSAAIPLAAVLGGPALGVLVLMVPFVVSSTVAWAFLQAGQPYLWQVVALCWAWWACRGALTATTRGRRALSMAGFAIFTSLAAWMNTASLGMVLALAIVELVRARARLPAALSIVGALGLSAAFEAALHRWYNGYCLRTFGGTFLTPLRLDRGNLLTNAGMVGIRFFQTLGLGPWLVAGAAGAMGARGPRRSREQGYDQLALVLLAASVLPGLMLVRYFRENGFAERYFALPAFWALGPFVLVTVDSLLAWGRVRRPWVLGVALVLLAVAVPAGPSDPLAGPRAEAARLAAEGPAVIVGEYLDVYVPASLAPRGVLVPIPRDGAFNRFPDLHPELRPGRVVLAPCAFDGPDGTLVQHRAVLRRVDGAPVEASGGPWCRHVVER